jgi:hypothetical protein
MRRHLFAFLGMLLIAGSLPALEAIGIVKKVDTEKNVLHVFAKGQDRVVPIDKDVKVLATDGKPLPDGLKAKELKEGAEVTITVEFDKSGPSLKAIRLGKHVDEGPKKGPMAKQPDTGGKASFGLKPLNEMTAADRYKGEDGGLYGGGANEPPAAHMAAAKKEAAQIVPRDADGKPAADGKIGLVSISMSNATQEYSRFKEIAGPDADKSPRVAIVDCAQGGQAMAQWVDPKARAWIEADRRLAAANVSPNQVQAVWVKLANVRPTGELSDHGRKLFKDTLVVLQNAKSRFPNLRIAYLGSRIYGGWSSGALNPEPYAYEGAFAARWLIQDQIKKEAALNFEGKEAKVPLLLWGPYFWADGTTPRKSDKLTWERADLGPDGTHPSNSGRQKVAEMLLKFFKEDPTSKDWFVKK